MEQTSPSAIERLVAHNGGPAKVSEKLGGQPVYQEIQRWVKRRWASPMHIFRLEPFMPDGMTPRDLHEDRERAKSEHPAPAPEPAAAGG